MTHTAAQGMVTAPHYLASQSGRDVLAEGGTAIEAAVAMAATLAVVYPHMNGIGGDSFWLISEPDGRVHGIDASGAAALAATPALYARAGHRTIPWRGGLAANTVAGTLSGWQALLLTNDGTLPLARLLRDAIHYANNGIAVTKGWANIASSKAAELRDDGYRALFMLDGAPLAEGALFQNPALARTLERLVEGGLRSFYEGPLAQDVARDLAQAGSPVTAADLAAHKATTIRPLTVSIRGAQLFNTPPPTQGMASLLILALFDRMKADHADGFAHIHGLVEATKQAFRFRDSHVEDPTAMTMDCQALLDNPAVLDAMRRDIDPERAAPWGQKPAGGDTVWFGAVDGRGQMVSAIQSLYFEFGSGVVLPQTGIVWQNRGASFSLAQTGCNLLRPGRKPFHTLNPALAKFSDGRVMAYGTMGGEGQPQTQAALFTRYARFGIPLQEAISAPRWLLGRTWGEEAAALKLEDRFDPALCAALRAAGHSVEVVEPFSQMMGHAGALVRHRDGALEGASDPRSDGAVAAC